MVVVVLSCVSQQVDTRNLGCCKTSIVTLKKKPNQQTFGGGYITSVDYCSLAVITMTVQDICALKMAMH